MNPAVLDHLTFLYGAAAARALQPQLEALCSQYAPPLKTRTTALSRKPLTQQDALLITYADQVREPGTPPLRTLAAFTARHLRGLLSGIHLLPFYPSSSDDGFSVKDFFAVDPAHGAWEDIARLATDFDLMFDAVFNHVSAQGEWFRGFLADDPRYRDFFITVAGDPDLARVVRPRALPLLTEFATAAGKKRVWTTFSADQADLNFRKPEVLLAVLEALLFYVRRGARFIRLDAIAFLWKEIGTPCLHLPQTHRVVRLLRAVLDEVAPQVRLITETNVPHLDNISYFGDGTNEAQLVYNFPLPPLVLHSLTTGSAAALTRWAQSLTLPSPHTTFFNFLASHDGIGLNPVRGILTDAEIDTLVARARDHGGFVSDKHLPDGSRLPYELNLSYLDALSDPRACEPPSLAARRFLVAHAILLSLQGMPGIYFHSLFGSRGDRQGAEASGIPRRINRQKLDRADLERELADPSSLRARVFGGLRQLLAVRRGCRAFAPAGAQEVLSLDDRVFAVVRLPTGGGAPVLCLHNVSPEPVAVRLPAGGRFGPGPWLALATPAPSVTSIAEPALRLTPHEWLWLTTTTD